MRKEFFILLVLLNFCFTKTMVATEDNIVRGHFKSDSFKEKLSKRGGLLEVSRTSERDFDAENGLLKRPLTKRIEHLSKLNLIYPINSKLDTQQLMNKKIVVHFWATWCSSCLQEIPQIINFLKEHGKRIDYFYFVSLDQDDNKHNKFWRQIFKGEIDFSHENVFVLQDKNNLTKELDILKVPETHVFQKGRLVRRMIGNQSWNDLSLLNFLESI